MRMDADIEIDRQAGEVFDYISNFENNPHWQRGANEARFITNPPLRNGSRFEQVADHRGRSIVTRFEVIDYEPGRSITIKSIESDIQTQVTRRVEPLGDRRTRVTADIQTEPAGMTRFLGPILRRFAQQAVDADYQRLKELLEQRL